MSSNLSLTLRSCQTLTREAKADLDIIRCRAIGLLPQFEEHINSLNDVFAIVYFAVRHVPFPQLEDICRKDCD